MGLLDYVAAPGQRVAYLFPEVSDPIKLPSGPSPFDISSWAATAGSLRDVFVFQFWPQQVQDNYTPNYATKNIPGASHPLYQWTSGNGREISFTANFVSEVSEVDELTTRDFRSRLSGQAASTNQTSALVGQGGPIDALLLPSSRYTVNVAAAIAALQQYLYPNYEKDVARPPKKLNLVLPGTKLGRTNSSDSILCIMRSASVTMESFFPTGELRSASVSLRFSEIIQHSVGSNSRIRYIGAEVYRGLAEKYTVSIKTPNDFTLG